MRQSIALWMAVIACGQAANLPAAEVLKPANERFAAETQEAPSFQRHVLPLMGRLGCNGRSCHGSFQGQGGFRLSLFGYDFKSDHEALLKGEKPRVDLKDVPESLMLLKASLETPHKGGKRMEVDSWEYKLLSRWIQSGAKGVEDDDIGFERLEISPSQIVFTKPNETVQLKVIVTWRDGQQEDVTPLCRFRTNDESVSEVSLDGVVKSLGSGDTHIVAFYDNGVAPVQTLLPVSNQIGPNYPSTPTPTKVDELVVQKLKTLGVVQSELSTDAEFLRRVSLDMTGTLPAPAEVESFLADTSADKRAKKIDELLERPAYSAWWATRMSDILGNNPVNFLDNNNGTGQRSATLWFTWLEKRLHDNMPYDKIIEGMMVANSRKAGQSYDDYLAEMAAAYRKDSPTDLNAHDSVPYFWERRTFNQPPERSMAVAYAFLGIRLQCAQCHKHPFDQWTQDDFNQFTNFFGRVVYREPADKASKARYNELTKVVKADKKDKGKKLLAAGEPFPFREVYVQPSGAPEKNAKGKENGKKPKVTQSVTARALGEDQITLNGDTDPRQLLMNWLREKDNPYFAKALVNRVWSAYFGVGIVEPADDLNLANPPSNAALLTYLEQEFVTRGYDLKWLHREIANSRTYQLSWRTNETNQHDSRNFSRAIPRRLPAEVAVDAIQLALATDTQVAEWAKQPSGRTISKTDGFVRNRGNADYALGIFGRPARLTNCDCERSTETSLLQTIYLRNDGEMYRKLSDSGWLKELDKRLGVVSVAQREKIKANKMVQEGKIQRRALKKGVEKAEALVAQLKAAEQTPEKVVELAAAEKELTERQVKFKQFKDAGPSNEPEPVVAGAEPAQTENKLADADWDSLIRQAYLRTVSRPPSAEELQRSKQYIIESEQTSTGMRDLVWALLNTKEFIVNH
ncbi:MAG: DUF1549 and DUF1553 domain-containing protein [Planctomycetota bacterium]